jgi:hypothetical protein
LVVVVGVAVGASIPLNTFLFFFLPCSVNPKPTACVYRSCV